MPRLETTRRRTPKHIQVDECALESLEGKLPNRTVCYQTFKIIKQYFESKSDAVNVNYFCHYWKLGVYPLLEKL